LISRFALLALLLSAPALSSSEPLPEKTAVFHVQGLSAQSLRRELERQGGRWAILGSRRNWTSFVPLEKTPVDVNRLSLVSLGSLIQLSFDRRDGMELKVWNAYGWRAETRIALGDGYLPGEEDLELFRMMGRLGIAKPSGWRNIVERLHDPAAERDAWLLDGGLEKALELPVVNPIPSPASEEVVLERAARAEVVGGRAERSNSRTPWLEHPPRRTAPRISFNAREQSVVELHLHYFSQLYSLEDLKLYRLYKKHLPFDRRGEVDDLVELRARRADEAKLRATLEGILSSVWEAEDWEAIIRDPELTARDALTPAQLEDWKQRLSAL
jgi:hypothetical protein